MNIYSLEFITRSFGSGVAVAIATGADSAFQQLRTQGRLNGTPDEYSLVSAEVVSTSSMPIECLVSERTGSYDIIVGPKGDRGPQGIQGSQGERGPQGPQGEPVALVQTTGQATDKAMSQKAVTDALGNKVTNYGSDGEVEITGSATYVQGDETLSLSSDNGGVSIVANNAEETQANISLNSYGGKIVMASGGTTINDVVSTINSKASASDLASKASQSDLDALAEVVGNVNDLLATI